MSVAGPRRAPTMVLFTDLDGTLLDARYRPGPATAALTRLSRAGVLVVFSSSKTRSEQEALRAELGVGGPFVVENGSAVLRADRDVGAPRAGAVEPYVLGVSARRCRDAVAAARASLGLRFRGFAEMSVAEVAAATGLAPAAATRARRREYSETLVGLGADDARRLAGALARRGLQLLPGGRHHTVSGAAADKGAALAWLMARLRRRHRAPGLPCVAVGDSENDVGMLVAADRAFLVGRADGRRLSVPGARQLRGVGPAGFAELADLLLSEAGA